MGRNTWLAGRPIIGLLTVFIFVTRSDTAPGLKATVPKHLSNKTRSTNSEIATTNRLSFRT